MFLESYVSYFQARERFYHAANNELPSGHGGFRKDVVANTSEEEMTSPTRRCLERPEQPPFILQYFFFAFSYRVWFCNPRSCSKEFTALFAFLAFVLFCPCAIFVCILPRLPTSTWPVTNYNPKYPPPNKMWNSVNQHAAAARLPISVVPDDSVRLCACFFFFISP